MMDSAPELRSIRKALDGVADPEDASAAAEEDRRDAAVALILRVGAPLDFLLIKRASSERDPWSGQMALPGGRWEQNDGGLLYTAQRETLEETGLDLGRGEPIGRLPDVVTQSPRLPKLRVAPFVFAVPHDATASVTSSTELDAVHWVPLAELDRPEVQSEFIIKLPGAQKRFPSYHVVGEHVWGMTYGILNRFLALIG